MCADTRGYSIPKAVQTELNSRGVKTILSSPYAFTAICKDGTVFVWGGTRQPGHHENGKQRLKSTPRSTLEGVGWKHEFADDVQASTTAKSSNPALQTTTARPLDLDSGQPGQSESLQQVNLQLLQQSAQTAPSVRGGYLIGTRTKVCQFLPLNVGLCVLSLDQLHMVSMQLMIGM